MATLHKGDNVDDDDGNNNNNNNNNNNEAKLVESLKKKLESKVLHSHHIRSVGRQLINEEDTLLWLSRGDLRGETESEIIATQDQVLQNIYHATYIYIYIYIYITNRNI